MNINNREDLTTSLFEEFSEFVPGGFYRFDLNHKLIGINSFALKTANAKRNDVLGKTLLEIHPKKMAEKIIANHKQVIKTGKKLHCEEMIEDFKTGKTVFFDVVLSPLYDENNKIYGVCGISTDITERKRLEEETIRQKNHLEKKLTFQKGYIRSYGYDYVDALKKISNTIQDIDERLFQLDVPYQVSSEIRPKFSDIHRAVTEIYSLYQKINMAILDQDTVESHVEINETIIYLEDLIKSEVDIADASISAKFDVDVSYDIEDRARQELLVDYTKLRYVIRHFFANYTKAITKESRAKDIYLSITATEGLHNKLYITFNFNGTVPFLAIEDNEIRAENVIEKDTDAAVSHKFAYDMALANRYVDILCQGEDLNDTLFQGSRFSFTLPFRKVNSNQKDKGFKPVLVL